MDNIQNIDSVNPLEQYMHPSPPSNNRRLFLIILIIFLGLLGSAILIFGKKFFSRNITPENENIIPTSTIIPTVDPTAGWKPYFYKECNLRLKYPPDWIIVTKDSISRFAPKGTGLLADLSLGSTTSDTYKKTGLPMALSINCLVNDQLKEIKDVYDKVFPTPIIFSLGNAVVTEYEGSWGDQKVNYDFVNINGKEIYITLWELSFKDTSKQIISTFQLSDTIPTRVANVSPPQNISLQFPSEEKWIKYEASCSGLKNNITIYYPQSWKIAKYGEENPNPSSNNKLNCKIQFGFPYSPGPEKDPYVDGLYGYVSVDSASAGGYQLTDVFQQLNKAELKIKSMYITDYLNRKWIKIIGDESASIFNVVGLVTVYKDTVYRISYGMINGQQLDAVSVEKLNATGEEFIQRLEFN